MHGNHPRREIAMRQLELIRRENPGQLKSESPFPLKVDDETLRALVALMAEVILAVAQCREVDDER
jgi:hypothetical protein